MRTELKKLEQVDAYLSGEQTAVEKRAFEDKLKHDSELQSLVSQQKSLIRVINRSALRAEISAVAAANAAASSGTGLTNVFLGVGGVLGIAGIFGAYFYFSEPTTNESDEMGEVVTNEITTEIDTIQPENTYQEEIYNDDIHEVNIEEPETVFSSIKKYENGEEETDKMSVNVQFKPSEDRAVTTPKNIEEKAKVKEKPKVKEEGLIKPKVAFTDRSVRAHFPEGNQAMKEFIDKNLHYPRSASNKNIEAVIRCEFIVTEDGLIQEINADCISMSDKGGEPYSDLKVLMNKRIMDAFIGNATHVLRTMPTWEPARNAAGSPVLSMQRMYFNYSIDHGCLVYQLDDDITIEEDGSDN
ncbi:hypothetical protein [Crocinitomix algicola]|uniref:hypothetical protein n=1 Tax=Crocinitomix algicola TaxID=1740263 RepID=UPI0008325FE8|nr:hypothetical protein [Crocinitomix algicola]